MDADAWLRGTREGVVGVTRSPHMAVCDVEDCAVCDSKLREMREVIRPLYLHCLTIDTDGSQAAVSDYTD